MYNHDSVFPFSRLNIIACGGDGGVLVLYAQWNFSSWPKKSEK
jgi:hypothetical protein